MTVSDGAPASPYAELMICLPPDWPVKSPMSDRRAYWPVRLLKTIARLPHEYHTWIGAWHSVLNEPESRLVSWGSMLGEHEPTEQLARLA